MNMSNQVAPRPRSEGLIVRALDDEMLVYDKAIDKAHCLNETAARAWKHCDGKRTVEEIAERMTVEFKAPVNTEVVWYALKELDRYHLLQGPITLPAEMVALSRRDFLKKVGVAAAVAAPIIFSISVPTPVQATTCLPTGSVGGCPGSGTQCCSGVCNAGVCA